MHLQGKEAGPPERGRCVCRKSLPPMFDRFKCNMSGVSLRLDGNDQLHRVLLLTRIVERGSGSNPGYQQNRSDFGMGRKPPTFGLFLQIR